MITLSSLIFCRDQVGLLNRANHGNHRDLQRTQCPIKLGVKIKSWIYSIWPWPCLLSSGWSQMEFIL